MSQEEVLTDLVNQHLDDDSLFLVELSIKGQGRQKVQILIDGDNGVKIEQCVGLSRKLEEALETETVFQGPYELVVSSSGVGQPLKQIRQYKANIGRRVEVLLANGDVKTGKLEALEGQTLSLLEEIKEKKKTIKKQVQLDFEAVKETKVLVSFK